MVVKKKITEIKKIFIVDDHPVVRQGLTQLINSSDNLKVCGDAEDVDSALKRICKLTPDLAIVDLSLKDSSGLDLCRALRNLDHPTPVLFLSMHNEEAYAERAFRAGGRGYIMKQEAPEKLLNAITKVINGDIYVSDVMLSKIVRKMADGKLKVGKEEINVNQLTNREHETFYLIGQGLSARQVATKMGVSIKTVDTYRAAIKAKLDFEHSSELTRQAIQWAQSSDGVMREKKDDG